MASVEVVQTPDLFQRSLCPARRGLPSKTRKINGLFADRNATKGSHANRIRGRHMRQISMSVDGEDCNISLAAGAINYGKPLFVSDTVMSVGEPGRGTDL